MIKVSLNEIYTETQKAVRSFNIDWGTAKDTAVLCKWLAMHDMSFLESLLKTLTMVTNKQLSLSINSNSKKNPLSATLIGILLVEYVSANKLTWEGYLNNYKHLIASMGLISHEQEIQLELRDEFKTLIAYTHNNDLYSNLDLISTFSNYFYLSAHKNINALQSLNLIKLNTDCIPLVNKKSWIKLKEIAFKTYVAESTTSRKIGAGY